MSKLSLIQNDFQQCVLDSTHEIAHVMQTKKVSVEARMGIYVNAYLSRLAEALAVNYPVLKKQMGDEQFYDLCFSYVQQFPSEFRSIRWFGHQFPDFLKKEKEDFSIVELARFEWILTEVFDAADADAMTMEDIAAMDPNVWATMKFIPHPTVRRLNLKWNVAALWRSVSEETPCPVIEKSSKPIAWIFWRKDKVNQFSSMTEDEAWAIDAMMHGDTFAEICEGLCEWFSEDEVAMRAASLLKSWIAAGLISRT